MKNTKVFLFFFFLIFAVCFTLPIIFMLPNLLEIPKLNEIVESGIEIEAEVVKGSAKSSISVNDVDYYSVQYKFNAQDGTGPHYGKTTQKYIRDEAINLKFVTIKYNPDNYESVEADYSVNDDPEILVSFICVVAFGLFDLAFWITEIVFIIKFIKFGIVTFKGKPFTAKFVAIKPGVVYNGTPLYSVAYSWTNENGEVCEGQSGDDYTLSEAHAFELAQEFKIMGYGNISKITSKPSRMIFKQAKEENVTVENYYICPYCNSMLPSNTTKCTSCGAPRKADSIANNQVQNNA